MQIIPQSVHLLDTDESHLHKYSAQANKSTQHGPPLRDSVDAPRGEEHPSGLLSLPSESLTHISAFLDPASLFSLGRTNKALHEHIDDDNTWHRAFACQFLDEGTERLNTQQCILLRRSEDTWKREFVSRCNVLRRWERCRNGTVSHIPHYSPVSAMHLLTDRSYGPSLLTVSLQYGVIARSFPLSGKVLKGFLSASDGFGMGNGNPNAEFTPNVTSCAVTSEGWSVHSVFGFANGEVALAGSTRVMESGRAATRVTRCIVDDQHRGPVADVIWDNAVFVTGGIDGDVRVWDSKTMRCTLLLKDQESLTPDACIQVLADLDRGFVLATKKSGSTVVWTGLSAATNSNVVNPIYPKYRIPSPSNSDVIPEPSRVFLDHSASTGILSYGIHFSGEMHFYRININLASGHCDVIRFSDGPLAPIQVIYPFITSAGDTGGTVILVGDGLGRVSLYDWSAMPATDHEVAPSFSRLDVFPDGFGVSAIACDTHVLVVGSTRGVTRIYDMLTLRFLREFSSPIPRPNASSTAVKDIIVERNLLIVSVGERILTWEAKPVRPHKPLAALKKSPAKGRNARWHKRYELAQDITESRKAVDDVNATERRSHERRRVHQAALAGLGLDENEALQYVLMLSRDEHALQMQAQAQVEPGVFEDDFDDIPPEGFDSRSSSSSQSEGSRNNDISSPLRPSLSDSPSTAARTQVTPPLRPEPIQAGRLQLSPSDLNGSNSRPLSLEDAGQFPALTPSTPNTPLHLSPASGPSSWSDRIKASLSSSEPTSTSPASPVPITSVPIRRSVSGPSTSGRSLLSETLRLQRQVENGGEVSVPPAQLRGEVEEEIDDDLKLALELSLAEALSLEGNSTREGHDT